MGDPRKPFTARTLVALTALAGVLHAQEPAEEPAPPRPALTELFGDAVRERLGEPALVDRPHEHLSDGRLARLLEDLHLQVKAFERSTDGDLALGFSYDVAKSLSGAVDVDAESLEFVASGNVAFARDSNRDDFLSTMLRTRWSGTRALGSSSETRAERAETLVDPAMEELAAFDPVGFGELSATFEQGASTSEVRDDPVFEAIAHGYLERLEHELPPELSWDFEIHAGLESNQDFSSRQVVLGSSLGGRLVSWDPEAKLSRYNVFDFPAATLRWLAGQDEDFRPSGAAYPTIVAGLDVVDAAREESRGALTDDESFLRARLEAGLESLAFHAGDEALLLSAGWRFYQELDAPAVVQRADTDAFSHLEISLDLPKGWSLTYSAGRLPLDARYDSMFALGFNLQLWSRARRTNFGVPSRTRASASYGAAQPMSASLQFALLAGLAGFAVHTGRVSQEAKQEPPPARPLPTHTDELAHGWAQWRGPLATGVAPHADPPVRWSESENVRWKSAIPGKGHSSPVLWGERVFLTTAVPFGDALGPIVDDAPGTHDSVPVTQQQRFLALALDRRDGKILWQTTLREELPHEGGHLTGSYASASPATDGEVLIAPFGSRGVYALDLEGKVLWKQELGRMATKHAHGEGSSPLLAGEFVVVVWDHEGDSFVAAFDRRTGVERWRVARDEETSWASPIAVEHGGRTQVVISGTKRIRAYELESGALLWQCGGLSSNVVCSPVSAGGLVFAGSSYESQALLAIDLSRARGEITDGEAVLWTRRRATPYVPSLLLVGDTLYFMHHYQGFLARVSARTGAEPERAFRLEGMDDLYASPVSAAGRVYVTDRSGLTLVLRHVAAGSGELEVLARNTLDDSFSASAALVGRELFLRGEQFLYCLAQR